MAGRSAPEWVALKLRVPRGFEDFWRLMVASQKLRGFFTTAGIVAETNVQRQSVEHYVARLVKAGIAVGEIHALDDKGFARENVYRLLKTPKAAPRVNDEGEIVASTAQERLWTAMRTLTTFGTRDLCFAARVDKPVKPKTAQRYINELVRAGYLAVQYPNGLRRPAVYRLKPSMNSGPLPPSILVTEQVWDRNRLEIVGASRTALKENAS